MLVSKTVQVFWPEKIMKNKRYKMRRKEFHKSKRRSVFNVCFLNLIWCQIILPSCADASTVATTSESTTIDIVPIVNIPEATNVENKIVFPSIPRNLSVKPYLVEHTPGTLQLNVSWINTKGERMPDDYSISVFSRNVTSKCPSTPCSEYQINGTKSWWLIPRSVSTVEGAGCSIKPGCSYNISLKAHPWNGRDKLTAEITLPDCVDNFCSCNHKSSLPKPIVNVTVKFNTVNVSWSLPDSSLVSDDTQFLQYKISIGEQKVVSAMHTTWYYHNQSYYIKWKDTNAQWKLINISDPLNHTYQARVSIVDTKGCAGPYGNKTFKIKAEQDMEVVEENTLIYIMIPIVAVLVLLSVGAFVFVSKRRPRGSTPCCLKLLLASARGDQSLRRQQVWPPGAIRIDDKQIALNANNNRRLEETCPLYVDKEIEDARFCGIADHWEISPNRIQYGKQIGEGAFGRVFIAKLDVKDKPIVAVKKLKDYATSDEVSEFISEIAMLKLVEKHKHVVALVGCCTLRQPYCAILEYAENGDLLQHLRNLRDNYHRHCNSSVFSATSTSMQPLRIPGNRPSVTETEYTTLDSEVSGTDTYVPNGRRISSATDASADVKAVIRALKTDYLSETTGMSLESDAFGGSSILMSDDTNSSIQSPERVLDPKELHSYALQIARGMEHLEKKGITHRDLAARNVLLDSNGVLKICDLGLSRAGIYVTNNRMKVPLRWLALEAIRSCYYSSKSDVWSYAVVLWEIGTLGGFPYAQLYDYQILGYLTMGLRLDKPVIVSNELYATMIRCWTEKPELRPSFTELVKLLESEDTKCRAYVDVSTLQNRVSFPPTETNATFNVDKLNGVISQ